MNPFITLTDARDGKRIKIHHERYDYIETDEGTEVCHRINDMVWNVKESFDEVSAMVDACHNDPYARAVLKFPISNSDDNAH